MTLEKQWGVVNVFGNECNVFGSKSRTNRKRLLYVFKLFTSCCVEYRQIDFENDSEVVVNLVCGDLKNLARSYLGNIIAGIKTNLKSLDDAHISYIRSAIEWAMRWYV
jgi:hypothetical protein